MNRIIPKTDLYEYLPYWYRPVADYQEILKAEIPTFIDAKNKLIELHQNFSLDLIDDKGIVEWEKIFGIVGVENQSIDDRRWTVKQRLWMHPPFTIRYLRQRLDSIIGENNYELTVYNNEYRIKLRAIRVAQTFDPEAIILIHRLKPAHIILEIEYIFNTWNDWHPYTWNQMHNSTWREAREVPMDELHF